MIYILIYLWYHILCNSASTKISEYFKLFALSLQDIRSKKSPKVAKNVSFLSFLKNYSLKECQYCKTFCNDYVSYTFYGTQLRARPLRISSFRICRGKGVKVPQNEQKCTKTGYTNLFAHGILQDILKFFF